MSCIAQKELKILTHCKAEGNLQAYQNHRADCESEKPSSSWVEERSSIQDSLLELQCSVCWKDCLNTQEGNLRTQASSYVFRRQERNWCPHVQAWPPHEAILEPSYWRWRVQVAISISKNKQTMNVYCSLTLSSTWLPTLELCTWPYYVFTPPPTHITFILSFVTQLNSTVPVHSLGCAFIWWRLTSYDMLLMLCSVA